MDEQVVLLVDLVLPLHASSDAVLDSATLEHYGEVSCTVDSDNVDATNQSSSTACQILTLHVHKARVLWRALRPLLFESSVKDARRALHCILLQCFPFELQVRQPTHVSSTATRTTVATSNERDPVDISSRSVDTFVLHRSIKLKLPLSLSVAASSRKVHTDTTTTRRIRLQILPPIETMASLVARNVVFDDYLFTGLLLRWEHQLIQAMSLTGYLATLGGGFFLCHHFTTAIRLAQWQQRLAVFLNDEGMYYTCAIHQAYSHVYAGHFRTARSMLRQILSQLTPTVVSDTPDAVARVASSSSSQQHATKYHPILIKMCYSARLFCKRMQQTAALGASTNASANGSVNGHQSARQPLAATIVHQNASSTIRRVRWDDYQRIRVVHDKSKVNDLVIPFARASVS